MMISTSESYLTIQTRNEVWLPIGKCVSDNIKFFITHTRLSHSVRKNNHPTSRNFICIMKLTKIAKKSMQSPLNFSVYFRTNYYSTLKVHNIMYMKESYIPHSHNLKYDLVSRFA